MTKDERIASATDSIMLAATQLLVADRHRAPKGQGRTPLTDDEAKAYVLEVGRLFVAASELVQKHAP